MLQGRVKVFRFLRAKMSCDLRPSLRSHPSARLNLQGIAFTATIASMGFSWPTFRLWHLFVTTALIAMLFAFRAWNINLGNAERAVANDIEKMGGVVVWRWSDNTEAAQVLLGYPESHVSYVSFSAFLDNRVSQESVDRTIEAIAHLPKLVELELAGKEIKNHHVALIAQCKDLQFLRLFGTGANGDVLHSIGSIEKLESLYIHSTIEDWPKSVDGYLKYLSHLRELQNLEILAVELTISNEEIERLAKMDLETINLSCFNQPEAISANSFATLTRGSRLQWVKGIPYVNRHKERSTVWYRPGL